MIIFYGNGIWANELATINSKKRLASEVGSVLKLPTNIVKFDYLYNETTPGTIGKLFDLYESSLQILDNDVNRLERMIDGIETMPKEVQDAYFHDISQPDFLSKVRAITVSRHLEQYRAALKCGQKIIVVAHSQGNLFANDAYKLLEQEGYSHPFDLVAVASPEPLVPVGAQYVTLDRDNVAAVFPLAGGPTANTSFGGLLPTVTCGIDPFCHQFVAAYMRSDNARNKIIGYIHDFLPPLPVLVGTITDADSGNVLAAVQLQAQFFVNDVPRTANVTANQTGKYVFTDDDITGKPSSVFVTATLSGFTDFERDQPFDAHVILLADFLARENPVIQNIRMRRLPPPPPLLASLRGTVTTITGNSAAVGARVELYSGAGQFIRFETTDARGFYLFDNLSSRTYSYIVTLGGTRFTSSTLFLGAGVQMTQNPTLNERTAPQVVGTLHMPSVNGVAGSVAVGVRVTLTQLGTAVVHEAVTDNHGNFSFFDLAPGQYLLHASMPGFHFDFDKEITVGTGAFKFERSFVMRRDGSFDFALTRLAVDGNILGSKDCDGVPEFVDQFNGTSVSNLFHCISPVTVRDSLLLFTDQDGFATVSLPFVTDKCQLGMGTNIHAREYLLRPGHGDATIIASFVAKEPATDTNYHVQLVTKVAGGHEQTLLLVTNYGHGTVLEFAAYNTDGSLRTRKEIPIDLSPASRIHLLLFYNDIDRRVSGWYRIDGNAGDPFTKVEVPLRGILFTNGSEAFVGVGGGARLPR